MDPTTVVSFDLFRQNQFPYMEVRRPFIVGTGDRQWQPTLSHFFLRLLHDKGQKKKCKQSLDPTDICPKFDPKLGRCAARR